MELATAVGVASAPRHCTRFSSLRSVSFSWNNSSLASTSSRSLSTSSASTSRRQLHVASAAVGIRETASGGGDSVRVKETLQPGSSVSSASPLLRCPCNCNWSCQSESQFWLHLLVSLLCAVRDGGC
jgi:hypothetical protein